MIARIETDEEIASTYDVMRQLRPHIAREEYVSIVKRMYANERFRLVAAIDDGKVQAVAGYRVIEMLYAGRMLVIDDLVTDEQARSKGHGRALLEWLRAEAKANGCATIHLDSRVDRKEAHRFYFREHFTILGFHFVETV